MKISVVLAAFSWMATTCQAFQSTQMPNNHVVTRHHPSSPMIARKEPSKSFSSTSSTSLQASPLTALTSSPLGAVTVLASVVIVHEAGHYLAARLFGINVTEFSIGFGPKLFGFEALGNEFNLRGLPLGGYVRFPENYNVTELQEKEKVVRQAYQARVKDENWSTVYELFNLATLGFWDQQQRRKKFAAMNEEYQTLLQENAQKPWWTQLSGRPKPKPPAGDPEEYSVDYFEDPSLLQNRPWFERAVVLSGGVIFNMILAFSIYFGEINLGSGLPQPVFDSGVIITQTPSSTSASVGVLRQGDVILGINGNELLMSSKGPPAVAASKQVNDMISSIRATPDGQSISLKVQRQGTVQDVQVQPKRTDLTAPQTIGVMLQPNFKEIQKIQSKDIGQAAKLAYEYWNQIFTQTLNGILGLFKMLIMGQSTGQSVSGPIGLIKTGTQVVSTQDWTAVLLFAAALSVNLGVINALPLPALDGGQLAFVLAEALTGKKIDQRLQEGITSVAVLFLLLVSISTAFSDVGSILSGAM